MNSEKVSVNITNFHKVFQYAHFDDVSNLKVSHVTSFITRHVIKICRLEYFIKFVTFTQLFHSSRAKMR